jgi:hypothetical protein
MGIGCFWEALQPKLLLSFASIDAVFFLILR